LDGEPVDGVTTIIGNGVPKPALVDWAARVTAAAAVDNWDELAQKSASERLRTLEKARWETTRAAATRGTDVHRLAERLAAGEEVTVPEPLVGHVDAYLKFVEDWRPREILVEVPIFNRTRRYAGTLDLIADLADGNRYVLDWKTTGSGIWPEAALQLCGYRYAEFYLDANGQEQPMPGVDQAGCVWLRADGYDLVPVDAGPETFRVFLYVQQVARFAKEPRERYVLEAAQAPA
jgi:hypothetical protein